MLEEEDHKSIDMVVLCIAALTYGATGCRHQPLPATGHTAFFIILCKVVLNENRTKDVQDFSVSIEKYFKD